MIKRPHVVVPNLLNKTDQRWVKLISLRLDEEPISKDMT